MLHLHIATALCFVAAVVFWRQRHADAAAQSNVGGALLFAGLGVYLGGLVSHWGVVTVPADVFGICGMSLTLAGLYANRFQGGATLWGIASGVAAMFFGAAALLSGEPLLQGEPMATLLKLHIGFILAATGFLVCLAGLAILYVVKEKALRRDPSGLARRLPSLDNLDRFQLRSLQAGFVLLSIGVAFGFQLWLFAAAGRPSIDILAVFTLVVWAVFAVTLYLRLWRGWRGHRLAMLTTVVVLLMIVVGAAALGLHGTGRG